MDNNNDGLNGNLQLKKEISFELNLNNFNRKIFLLNLDLNSFNIHADASELSQSEKTYTFATNNSINKDSDINDELGSRVSEKKYALHFNIDKNISKKNSLESIKKDNYIPSFLNKKKKND